ncbi:FliO/MopB family protein [Effusibacillus pohliae]|uniref:FliO/MopB family protein n=1 Tax=Effusibacillus pohliae TaxID=232270 RepID=UPI0003677579|nr:flagellar biosynthetic protein FliO [Effusibacillus pohliae]
MGTLALGESVEDMIKRGGQGSGTQPPPAGGQSDWSLLLGMVELLVVLGVVAGVIYLLIRFLARNTRAGRSHSLLRTVAVHPLAANRTIYLVALEDRIYVVGVGEDVTLLDVITDQGVADRIKNQASASAGPDFPAWLANWRLPQRKSDPGEPMQAPSFQEILQSKLRQFKEQRKKFRKWDSDQR